MAAVARWPQSPARRTWIGRRVGVEHDGDPCKAGCNFLEQIKPSIRSGKPVRLAMFVADAVGLAGGVSGSAVSNAGLRGDVGYTIASSFSFVKRPSTVARNSGRP
jgi:hypothetical protein